MPDHPVFDQFNLVVRDMTASVAFFELLGCEVPDTEPEWQDHHRNVRFGEDAGLDLDLDSVEFAAQWNRGWPGGSGGPMGVLGLRVASRSDVDEIYARVVAAGHTGQQEPYDAFWGSRYAVVQDPDGNAIGLMSPPEDDRRRTPTPPPG